MEIKRIYNNQQESHKAIFNDTYKYSEVSKTQDFLKNNINKITKIDGYEVTVLGMYNKDIEYTLIGSNTPIVRPFIYLDVELKITQ